MNKQTKASDLPIFNGKRFYAAAVLKHSAVVHVAGAALCGQFFSLTVRQMLGWEFDPLDAVALLIFLIGGYPILTRLRVKQSPAALPLGGLFGLLLAGEALEIALRRAAGLEQQFMGNALDIAGYLLWTAPLIYYVALSVRERMEADEQIGYLSSRDMLTGLVNRRTFELELDEAIRKADANETKLAVLFIDLDRFKHVNESFGHKTGDLLLVDAAERLSRGLRGEHIVSRQGGDEFTVLISGIQDASEAATVARKLIVMLSEPYGMEGYELRIGCSIGIAVYPADGSDSVTLLKNADTAMYRVKEQGKNHYRLYSPEMNDNVIQKLVMEEWLNKALERDEFELHYQPQGHIATKALNGMEALLRWKHPQLGYISPAEFIPLAEETGQILPIGEWVLRTACRQNKRWQEAGYPPVKIAVNISPIQFHQPDFVDIVLSALEESGLDAVYLDLEITEGIAMVQVEEVIRKLGDLRAIGVHISIDDFGTGYSSLSYLKRFPITTLKIAQQFVRDITDDPDDAAIVQAIVGMAHNLKLNVIAEGVETEQQLRFLEEAQCQEIQGYILSKPLPPSQFEHRLLKAEFVM